MLGYLLALAGAAAALALAALHAGHGLSSGWALLLIAALAAASERGTVRLSPTLEVSVALVPMLLVAVAFGPTAAMLVGAASMLGDLRRPYLRWAVYTVSRALTGGVAGLAAVLVLDSLGRNDLRGLGVATIVATLVAQALDAAFCALTLKLRRTGGLADVVALVPTIVLSTAIFAPILALLAFAYERISPWTLVLFLVPALVVERLLVLYRRERRLSGELAAANVHLRRRDAILQTVSFAAQRFVEASSLDEAANDLVAQLGEASEAEHVFVFETDGPQSTLRYSWSRGGTEVLPTLALSAPDQAVVPIVAGHVRWGLIGFAQRRDGDTWSAGEVDGLRAAAGILGAAIERRRAEEELRSRDEQLRQSQKMEAIGRLAGGIAHDFNNLLTAISGYSEFLVAGLDSEDPRRADAIEIRSAAARAATLTRQLLSFSRKQAVTRQLVDVGDVVRDLDGLLQRVLGEDIELRVELGTGLEPVLADPGQLQQVVLNLAVNARDAMPDGGRLVLRTAGAAMPDGAAVLLEVADTGQGMEDSIRQQIFEPFFTTKEVGKGTGLGLAIVHGLVEQSGGRIEVESELSRGTIFRIYLPVATGPAEPVPAAVAKRTPSGGSETILLVEDEAAVRALAARILRGAGYSVLEAADADEALALSESHEGLIELLLTDVVMPRTSGPQLAEIIAGRRLFAKFLFMSGYTADTLADSRLAPRGASLLPKPFTPDSLLAAVREALDAPMDAISPAVS